jgi:hypothetical protein
VHGHVLRLSSNIKYRRGPAADRHARRKCVRMPAQPRAVSSGVCRCSIAAVRPTGPAQKTARVAAGLVAWMDLVLAIRQSAASTDRYPEAGGKLGLEMRHHSHGGLGRCVSIHM